MTDQEDATGRIWRKVSLRSPIPGEFLPLTDEEAWADIPTPDVPDGCRLVRYVRVHRIDRQERQRTPVYAIEDRAGAVISVVDRDGWDPDWPGPGAEPLS